MNQKERNKALTKVIGLNLIGFLIFALLGFGGSASAKKEYEDKVVSLKNDSIKLYNLQLKITERDSVDKKIVQISDSINEYHQQFINQIPKKSGSALLDPKMQSILDDLETSKKDLEYFTKELSTKNKVGNGLVAAYNNLYVSNSALAANISVNEKDERKRETSGDCSKEINDLVKEYEIKIAELEGSVSYLNGKIQKLRSNKNNNTSPLSQSSQQKIDELIQDIRPIAQKAEESIGGFLKLKRKDKALKDIANELNQIVDYYTSK